MAHRPHEAARPPGPRGVLADDLTGACDTALQFLRGEGGEAWVLPEPRELKGGQAARVLSLNLESRHLSAADASRRVEVGARQLALAGVTRFYHKVDSTLRGNLASEAAALMRAASLELAIVAPAFPQAGRITVGGYQLVDGVPVSASAYARDPITPVVESHLPRLIARQFEARMVAHIELGTVMQGSGAILGAFARAIADGKRFLVVDAARPEDLEALAGALALAPYRLLPVGSAGLARALAGGLQTPPASAVHRLVGQSRPVLVAAGSTNPVTSQQVRALREATVIELDVQALLVGSATAVDRVVGLARQHLLARRDVVITTALDPARVEKDRALARQLAITPTRLGQQVADALGLAVARLSAECPLAGLVLAGGDTALAACRALGGGQAAPLRLFDVLLSEVPLGRLDTPQGSLALATKSGGFGGPDALNALARGLKLWSADQARP